MKTAYVSEEFRSGRVLAHGKIVSLSGGFELPSGELFTLYARPKENASADMSDIVLNVRLARDNSPSNVPIKLNEWSILLIEHIEAGQESVLESVDLYWGSGDYVEQGKCKVTTEPTANTLVYSGDAQELLTAGAGTGVMKYKLGDEEWSADIPTATNVGVYPTKYKVTDPNGLNADSPVSILRCAIAEKFVHDPTIVLSPSSFTYSGEACVPSVVVKDGNRVIPAEEYTIQLSDNVNAGTATVTIVDKIAGNYDVIGTKTFQIAKATPTVVAPTAKVLTYDGQEQALANAGTTDFGTLQYSLDNENWGTTIPSATNAGSYTLYYRVVGDENINDVAAQTVACSIAKAAPTYTAPTGKTGLEYTGQAQALLNAGSTSDGTIKYSLDGTNWGTSVPTGTEAQTYTCYWKLEGDTNHNDVAQATISVEIAGIQPTVQAVDLGLPSGKLWANMNIGATSEEGDGLYFAWGETTGYADANARNAALGRSDGFSADAYTATGASQISADLTLAQDAARANLGGDWRMPTQAEFDELIANTDHEWTTINGVDGRKFTNKNDSSKFIFIPASGCYSGTSLNSKGSVGFYWSSTYDDKSFAYHLSFGRSSVNTVRFYRRDGYTIRAIQDAPPSVEFVDLGLPSGLKWAKTNLGATNEEDDGLYYAWGETTGYADAAARNAALGFTGGFDQTSYQVTGASAISADLTLAQDAANVALGGSCRMPTKTECDELIANTNNEWTTVNGVAGCKFTNKNDSTKYIFIPASGLYNGTSLGNKGSSGNCWSSTYNGTKAYILNFNSSNFRTSSEFRRYGFTVRAVQPTA